jgi:hypothetical protein
MRRPIVLAVLLGTTSTATATTPAYPICDADNGSPGFVVEGPGGGAPPGCPVRWIAPALRPGGVTFELWRDGQLVETRLDTEAADEMAPQRRHECDGSVVDTFAVLASYTVEFPDAQPGDEIQISDAGGSIGVTYVGTASGCPAIDLVAEECQVCVPDGPGGFGCLSAAPGGGGAGGGGAPWGVILVGVAVMIGRRARTAGRGRAARSGRPD